MQPIVGRRWHQAGIWRGGPSRGALTGRGGVSYIRCKDAAGEGCHSCVRGGRCQAPPRLHNLNLQENQVAGLQDAAGVDFEGIGVRGLRTTEVRRNFHSHASPKRRCHTLRYCRTQCVSMQTRESC
eukprot:9468239-Pyramimonas_sp.AAC.1